ncbi:NACHT, LRR and PYD domains-containing protein 5 [Myotis myotis]|uniref:NLR family pyrin domain containing 5 n=1 Tax=Myotis myotis TaxID=51298 RepID=A0A7J7R0D6_MYOMY|nr:NACHT, LRR and PYD domains-containing protein 5 [Myotis myotis]KAF6269552.1 NLR family pyrin domain containing 5 [Myotis myotis]
MGEANVSPFSDCGLRWCLQQLDKEEFHTFKELLMGSTSGLVPGSFPWMEVAGADAQHLAFLLHEHCRALVVWSMAMDIFLEMNLPVLSQKAKEEMEKCSLAEILQDFTPTKTDQGTSMGQPSEMSKVIKQDDTTAAKTKDQGQGGDKENYKHHVKKRFATVSGVHHSFKTFAADCPQMQMLSGAFAPDQQGFRPLTVVLHGRPGVGKSALARRILLHWARGELYPGVFSYVFFLDARDIPWRRRSSFTELISREWPDPEVPVANIMSQPDRLLFVVDGFDDLDVAPENADLNVCDNWTEKRPVSDLMCSLLKKALLPESSLIVTVRDESLEKLCSMLISPRYLFIEGIAMEKRIQVFLKHVKNEDQKTQVLHEVLDNHVLIDRCQVSVTWWLLCRALELQTASGKGLPPTCQVLTGLYATFVAHQLAPRDGPGRCLSPDERVVLKGLCRMAVQGVWARKFVFYSDDLGIHGLTEPELSVLFHKYILLRDSQGERCFTFLHPSLQEFYAALYYVLEGLEAEWEPHALCIENSKSLKELKQVSFNVHVLQMKRFLFGFMNKEVVRALEDLLGCPVALVVRRVLLQWVSLLGQQATTTSPLDFLDSFYCLFETQDEEFVRLALRSFREVRLTMNRPMDLKVSSFCLQHCQRLREIQMDVREIFPEDEATEAWPVVPQGLQTKPLVIEWWENLCSVLSTHPSLQQLDLAGSILSEWAMRTLCVKLRQPTCQIQKLIFKGTQITLGLPHLWKTLIVNHNIKHLNLDNIHLQEEDIGVVQEALKHPHCLLESLRLDHCGLTDSCCPLISQILLASHNLRSLSLAGNKVADQGVASLCEALKVSQCALHRLILGNCGLTAAACQHLSEVLTSSQSLTHLDLSTNPLGKDGMTLLCRSLKCFTCAVQRLMLRDCHLDVIGCGFLSLGLMGNRHLTHLSLSMNPLGDDGVDLLCEVLLETTFHLQDLELVRCGLTAACCRKLSLVIMTNTHLKSLDLAANALGDDGVAALCMGLRLKTASLQRLGLEACELTSGCCEALASALLCNRYLRSLNLLRNNLCPEGIRELCRAFGRPTSKLQVIGLWKWQYPDPVIKLLDEAQLRRPHMVIDGRWYASDGEDEGDRYWWRN